MTQRTVIDNARIITPSAILENTSLWIEDGRIVQMSPALPSTDGWELIDAKNAYVLPAWIDLHLHGMGGFGPEQGTPQALLELSCILARQGVSAFCPTLYCAQPAKMASLLGQLTPIIGQETGAKILGFHLEGPFISPQKPGVMKSQDIAPANLKDFQQIYDASEGKIAIITLAPEIPNIDPIIKFCTQHRIRVQAGHTNATYEQMQTAFEKGVRRVTHWGNAMSGLHQRAPGVFGAALINNDISCEVIADGKHVHPALLTLLRKVKPISQITAITDALRPTQQLKGPFIANDEEVVLLDGVWKRKTDEVTAGSALTMQAAFKQLLHAGYSLPEASCCTSTNAARLFNLPQGKIDINAPADLLLVSQDYQLQQVWLNGRPIM